MLHVLFEMLGFIVGYRYYLSLRGNYPDKITSANRVWILIGAAAGAFLFSRIVGALENPKLLSDSVLSALNNRTIVGGLLGGLLGVELVKKVIGESNSSGDLFTFPIIVALAIGRLGCLFSSLSDNTVGVATTLPWGIDFGDGVFRHPTNLYEILFLVILWGTMIKTKQSFSLADGSLFKIFMIAYLSFRFVIDFIKPYEVTVGILNSIQVACLIGLVYYIRYLFNPGRLIKPSNA